MARTGLTGISVAHGRPKRPRRSHHPHRPVRPRRGRGGGRRRRDAALHRLRGGRGADADSVRSCPRRLHPRAGPARRVVQSGGERSGGHHFFPVAPFSARRRARFRFRPLRRSPSRPRPDRCGLRPLRSRHGAGLHQRAGSARLRSRSRARRVPPRPARHPHSLPVRPALLDQRSLRAAVDFPPARTRAPVQEASAGGNQGLLGALHRVVGGRSPPDPSGGRALHVPRLPGGAGKEAAPHVRSGAHGHAHGAGGRPGHRRDPGHPGHPSRAIHQRTPLFAGTRRLVDMAASRLEEEAANSGPGATSRSVRRRVVRAFPPIPIRRAVLRAVRRNLGALRLQQRDVLAGNRGSLQLDGVVPADARIVEQRLDVAQFPVVVEH